MTLAPAPTAPAASLGDEAVARIDRDELVELALTICNIDSAGPTEGPVGQYVHDWLQHEGFKTRKVGLTADRFNVLGRWRGTGGGLSLLCNAHLDTAVRVEHQWTRKAPEADVYHKAWIEGSDLVGEGIVNDKGPMAAFLIAGKAVRATGTRLKGDLLLTAAIGETSSEPDDSPPGTIVEGKDLGARWLATHGGVADYALIAEGTGFSIVSVEAGMAWYKVTYISDQPHYYVPYLPDRTTFVESPNMVVRASVAVQALERWATAYQEKYAYESSGGPVVPKAHVGAIRGGDSTHISATPAVCALYVGAFITPHADPLAIGVEIEDALRKAEVPPTDVELYAYHRGHEARGIDRLREAVLRAHRDTFGTEPPPPHAPTSSMWRDINVWNELGIPALTYGPRSSTHAQRRAFPIEALYQAACVYARTIVDVCNQEKPRLGP